MSKLALLFLVPFLLASAPAPARAAGGGLPPSGFKVGAPFPDIALPSLQDGRAVKLSSFRGRKLILQIFASW